MHLPPFGFISLLSLCPVWRERKVVEIMAEREREREDGWLNKRRGT